LKGPLVTAHTGCMQTPLNSIQSVLEGLDAGADIIEVDVRATKDGIAVLVHDEHVQTAVETRRVQDMTFEELQAFTVDQNEIVRLDEVLPLIKDKHRVINLDIKEDHAIDPMIKTVEHHQMRDFSIISGCEKDRASHLKKHYRPYQVLLNASVQSLKDRTVDYDSFIQETCDNAIMAGCCGININHHFCREELIDYAMLRCLPVLVWTVDTSEAMERFLKYGVHSITSNEVKTLMDLRNHLSV
jgi:glycerophosphoryl diester phosphodiesterase